MAKDTNKTAKDGGALTGTGKAQQMMPTGAKMNKESNADPAIKKETSSLLHKEKAKGDNNDVKDEDEIATP